MNQFKDASIVLTGGGTGGHLYPALAVADSLVRDFGFPLQNITYIGNEESLESQKVPTKGIPFFPLVSHGMPRSKNPMALLKWGFEMLQATALAARYLKAVKANVVLGTGGYVSGPVLLAAQALRIPFVVHESDAVPGLVNRLMASKASVVTGAFAHVQSKLKVKSERFQHTGNPVNENIGKLSKADALSQLAYALPQTWQETDKILLVLGGSQGALSLNEAVFNNLDALIEAGYKIVHQCGTKHYKAIKLAFLEKYGTETPFNKDYIYLSFIDNMPAVWALADLALCRAGSMTLSELFASQTPAILVPYPYAAQNHQEANARFVEAQGAGIVLLDADLKNVSILDQVNALIADDAHLLQMKQVLEGLAKPTATKTITNILLQLL
ncbi:MAG: undecaprenyldiphospho-muramoylpentapeptide beta-N-acetylglucosaminyltransferase [Vampirovibrionales bacterium]